MLMGESWRGCRPIVTRNLSKLDPPLHRIGTRGEVVLVPTSTRFRLRCDRCKTENTYDAEALIVLATEAGIAGKKYVRLPRSVESCPSVCP
jgi:hypothetical protein